MGLWQWIWRLAIVFLESDSTWVDFDLKKVVCSGCAHLRTKNLHKSNHVLVGIRVPFQVPNILCKLACVPEIQHQIYVRPCRYFLNHMTKALCFGTLNPSATVPIKVCTEMQLNISHDWKGERHWKTWINLLQNRRTRCGFRKT